MPHAIEVASSGRSKCRGCNKPITKASLRLGERLPNSFGDGEMTLWYHLMCGAYRRPEALLAALNTHGETLEEETALKQAAQLSLEHPRLPRIGAAQLASSGRARCRHCRELIDKGAWRLPLVFFEDGMFNASGFVHLSCAAKYCETNSVIDAIEHFSEDLSANELAEIRQQLQDNTS